MSYNELKKLGWTSIPSAQSQKFTILKMVGTGSQFQITKIQTFQNIDKVHYILLARKFNANLLL